MSPVVKFVVLSLLAAVVYAGAYVVLSRRAERRIPQGMRYEDILRRDR